MHLKQYELKLWCVFKIKHTNKLLKCTEGRGEGAFIWDVSAVSNSTAHRSENLTVITCAGTKQDNLITFRESIESILQHVIG